MKVFGFIGCGNMGGALASAVAKTGISGSNLLLSNKTHAKAEALAKSLSATVADNITVAEKSDFVFLGVKPGIIREVVTEILPYLSKNTVLVSMAAGVSLASIKDIAGSIPLIRIMPNTPVAVGKGVVLYCSTGVSEEQLSEFKNSLKLTGLLLPISEKLIDAGSAVSGCGPAYAYMFLQAMADGAVKCGLNRADATALAANTLLGAAEMVLKTGEHPEKLKDDVCSPAGSTIAGVHALEQGNFRNSVMECIYAAYLRTKELS